MKICVTIPNNWGIKDPAQLADMATLVEALGYHAIFTMEHVTHMPYVANRLGDGPYYSALSTLSFIAARTTKIGLGTSVLILPFHNPLELAKYLATLDHLSRGRVIFGPGVGGLPEEFAAAGIPWTERGARTDEALHVIKQVWSQDVATFKGKHWQLDDIRVFPKPYQRTECTTWIGGVSPPAKRRAARMGHGWQPSAINVDQFRTGVQEVQELLKAEGRDPAKIVATARAFQDAGATHFMFALNSGTMSAYEKAARLIAKELL